MKALAVDVGGTTIKAAVVRADGTLSTVATAPTPRGADATVAAVAALLATFPATVSGPVGVVVPGIVDETRGVGVLSANIGWYDAPLRDLLTDALGREVVLGHDVRSGALAEARWGRAVTSSSMCPSARASRWPTSSTAPPRATPGPARSARS